MPHQPRLGRHHVQILRFLPELQELSGAAEHIVLKTEGSNFFMQQGQIDGTIFGEAKCKAAHSRNMRWPTCVLLEIHEL